MHARLRRTWLLLLLAAVAALATGAPIARDLVDRARLPVVRAMTALRDPGADASRPALARVTLGEPDDDGVLFVEDEHGAVVAPIGCGEASACPRVAPAHGIEHLSWPEPLARGVLPPLVVERLGDGLYRMTREGQPILVARVVLAPGRRVFHAPALLGRDALPGGVSLVALLALAFAAARSRRAIRYARTLHGWREATLGATGMLSDEDGRPLGVLHAGAHVPPGQVLVDPAALLRDADAYRGTRVLAARDVVRGGHRDWSLGAGVRLRDANVLAVVATLAAALAYAAFLSCSR